MKTIAYLTNSSTYSGVGYYATGLKKAIQASGEVGLREYSLLDRRLIVDTEEKASLRRWPGVLGAKSVNWIRLGRKLPQYLRDEKLVHATNQTLSFIKTDRPMVVTVHDIIELLEPQDKKAYILNKYLLSGILKAVHIIAVSNYTKKTIHDYYGISDEDITVIPNGLDAHIFHPIENFRQSLAYQVLSKELRLSADQPVVLYVGSDHPRKNVGTAIRAFAKLKETYAHAIFLKVGEAGLPAGREHLLGEIDRLHLRESVRFMGSVTTERLNEIYNLANVLIFPSRFEGFGLPPLQAMAAGTPVVCSHATSLPEVVGEAGLLHDPDDVDGFADDILRLIEDKQLRQKNVTLGLEQAQRFSWKEVAQQTVNVYEKSVIA